METEKQIEVAAAVIFRDGKLLITQRHADAHLGGMWEFPGGKREPDETFEQCVVRELHEELGIEAEAGELLASITHDYPEKSVHLKFFICRLINGEPQPTGCSACKWVNKSALAQYTFPAADVRLLEKLRQAPGFWSADARL